MNGIQISAEDDQQFEIASVGERQKVEVDYLKDAESKNILSDGTAEQIYNWYIDVDNGDRKDVYQTYYNSEDDKQGNKVTVKKVICVQSEEEVKKYNLESVHTTNLKGLTFKLYPVLEKNEKSAQTVTENGKTYSYLLESREEGEYINLEKNLPSESEYKNADSSKHKSNYDSYGNVQSHAEALYWLVKNPLTPSNDNPTTLNNKKYNRTYYVCEVSWTETTKETDIFYILAQIA